MNIKGPAWSPCMLQVFPFCLPSHPAGPYLSNLFPFFPADVPVEKLAAMPALRVINLRLNPLSAEVHVIAPPLIKFDMLMSPEDTQAPPP